MASGHGMLLASQLDTEKTQPHPLGSYVLSFKLGNCVEICIDIILVRRNQKISDSITYKLRRSKKVSLGRYSNASKLSPLNVICMLITGNSVSCFCYRL